MSWLELFFAAIALNLCATAVLMWLHRQADGTSPWWEGGLMVAGVLWVATCILRVAADVVGASFPGGAMAVQTFFWAGLTSVLLFWTASQLRWFSLHWGLNETSKPNTPAN